MSAGHKTTCPKCGLLVFVAGQLLSYHEWINGCRALELKKGRW